MEKMKFDNNYENLTSLREKSLDLIKENPELLKFIEEYNINDVIIMKNASKFLRYIDLNKYCCNCKSVNDCKSSLNGFKAVLEYDEYDNSIELNFKPCEINEKKLELDKKFVYRDFDDSIFEYDFKELLLNQDYKNVRKDTVAHLLNIIKKRSEKGLYLYGPRQNGKSFILSVFAKTMVKELKCNACFIDSVSRVKDINDLYFLNKDAFNENLKEYINCDILIFDDFGNEYKNEIIRDMIIYPILNERFRQRKLTLFSSNYSLDDIEKMYSLKENYSPRAKQLRELIEASCKCIYLNSLPYRD